MTNLAVKLLCVCYPLTAPWGFRIRLPCGLPLFTSPMSDDDFPWYWIIVGLFNLAAVVYFLYRRKKRAEERSRQIAATNQFMTEVNGGAEAAVYSYPQGPIQYSQPIASADLYSDSGTPQHSPTHMSPNQTNLYHSYPPPQQQPHSPTFGGNIYGQSNNLYGQSPAQNIYGQ